MDADIFWHAISEPHKNGKADGVELMDVSGRIYQTRGEVILDGNASGKRSVLGKTVLAWRIKDGR